MAPWLEGAWMVIRIKRSVWLECREQVCNMERKFKRCVFGGWR